MEAKEFSSIFLHKMRFLEDCSQWRDFPPKPVVYMLVNEPFEYGNTITDILYIGETKHFGSIPNNCRLWDYHSKATQHERNIVEKVNQLENAGKYVEIWWSYEFPNKYTHKDYEKFCFSDTFKNTEDHPNSIRSKLQAVTLILEKIQLYLVELTLLTQKRHHKE